MFRSSRHSWHVAIIFVVELCLLPVSAQLPLAADLSQRELRESIQRTLTIPKEELSDETARLRDVAMSRLVLDTDRLTWQDSRLNWVVRRRRKLEGRERLAALAALDGFLRRALSEFSPSDGGRALTPTEAESILNQSQLSIAAQPCLWEVTPEQLSDVLRRAMRDSRASSKLAKMRSEFVLRTEDRAYIPIELTNGLVTWHLEPNNPPDVGNLGGRFPNPRQIQALMEQQNREMQRKLDPYRKDLSDFLKSALGTLDVPELGVPLLDPEDVEGLRFEFLVDEVAMAGGPAGAGVQLVSASATRGAALRTISRIQFQSGRKTNRWSPDEDPLRIRNFPVDGPPHLVVDTGAFSGAVVNKLAFSPDGRLLAAAGDLVRIWDVQSGELRHTLRGQKSWAASGGCTDLSFTADGRQLLVAAAGFEECLRIYDVAAPTGIREVHAGHDGHIERLAISWDGKLLATYGVDRRLQIWDWPNRRIVAAFKADEPIDHLSFPTSRPNVLAVTGKGNFLWMRVPDGLGVDSAARGKLERVLGDKSWPWDGSPHPFAIDLQWLRRRYLVGGISRQDGRHRYWVRMWRDDDTVAELVHEHGYYVTACALNAEGTLAASADALGSVHVWDTSSGEVRHDFASRTSPVYGIRYDQEADRVAFGRKPLPTSQWSRNTYANLDQVFELGQRRLSNLTDASRPAAVTRQDGYQVDVRKQTDGTLTLVSQGPNGSRSLPFGGSTQFQPLWHSFLRGNAIGFENAIIMGAEDGSVVCLDPNSLLSRRQFVGHASSVWGASQSADNKLLLTGSADGTIRGWRLEPPKDWGNLAILADDDGKVYHVFPDTPTARAGIRSGDFIRSVNGQTLSDLRQSFAISERWDLKAGQKVKVDFQRGGSVQEREIELSPTGDIGRPVFNLFITADEKDWVLWTAEGYYDASPGGHQLIGWHVNRGLQNAAEFLPVERFRDQYCRPRLLDAVLKTHDLQLALRQVEGGGEVGGAGRPGEPGTPVPPAPSAGISPAAVVQQPPEVTIVSPANGFITGSAEVEVEARISTTKGLNNLEVSVLVNGKPAAAKNIERVSPPEPSRVGGNLVGRTQRETFTVRRAVRLAPGANEIHVVASNAAAHQRSAGHWVTYRESVAPRPNRRLFVLAIGVSHYKDSRFNLQFAHADAESFVLACQQQENGLYDTVETRLVLNENAVESGIEDAFDWLVSQVDQDDVAILFLSGHGVMDDRENYYFATHDVDPEHLRATCLRWSSVHDLARDLNGTFVLFADTCHSGGVAGVKAIIGDPLHRLVRDDLGTMVFASSGRSVQSLEDAKWGHGAFTHALLDILRTPNGDLDNPPDGHISVSELEHGLDRRIRELTSDRQRPVSQKPETVHDFDLFKASSANGVTP